MVGWSGYAILINLFFTQCYPSCWYLFYASYWSKFWNDLILFCGYYLILFYISVPLINDWILLSGVFPGCSLQLQFVRHYVEQWYSLTVLDFVGLYGFSMGLTISRAILVAPFSKWAVPFFSLCCWTYHLDRNAKK